MRLALVLALAAAPATAQEACRLDPRGAPEAVVTFEGVARGPATSQEIAAQTAVAVARAHAPISAKYANLPRAYVYFVTGGSRHGTIASVLDGVMPQPGEIVTLVSRHRDPEAPCAFIPWTITKGAGEKPTS